MWGFGQTLAIILSLVPLWGMYERIYGTIILIDLIEEVKLTAIKDTKIRGLHQTILPISASNRAIGPTFGPEVFGTHWFRRIVVLIFGMALIPAIYHIYIFGYLDPIDDLSLLLGLVLPFIIYVCWCSIILLIVTFVCLCLHFGKRQLVLWLGPLGARFDKLHENTKRKIQNWLWAFLLSSIFGFLAILHIRVPRIV